MAALTFFVCSSVQQFCEIAYAFVYRGYSFRQSLAHLQKQQRLRLFHKYCREAWLQEASRISITGGYVTSKLRVQHNKVASAKQLFNMQRADIDFAAIEASAVAFDTLDNFSANYGNDAFMDAERRHTLDTKPAAQDFNDIEVIAGDEVDTTFYEYIDTLPVYHNTDIGPLQEGVSLTVTGHILMNCERFSINFIIDNDTRDVALHINPRLPQSYIVRNTKVRHVWGAEEVTSPQPFSLHRGNKFTIQVLVTEACYMISINGQHFAEYAHRMPYSAVSIIEVKGDVEQVTMQRDVVTEYPARLLLAEPLPIPVHSKSNGKQQPENQTQGKCECEPGCCDGCDETDKKNFCMPLSWRIIPSPRMRVASKNNSTEPGLPLPYFGLLPAQSLLTGRCLVIEGRVKLLPHSFYINLQCGQHIWPHPIIAFHFNPRFSKQCVGAIGKAVVCRNAWFNGSWADEERSELDTNLLPGKSFQLAIVCGERAFEVYVNKNHITSFKYRVLPAVVDTVYIQGDIKLWQVVLETHFDKDDATNETCRQAIPFHVEPEHIADNVR